LPCCERPRGPAGGAKGKEEVAQETEKEGK